MMTQASSGVAVRVHISDWLAENTYIVVSTKPGHFEIIAARQLTHDELVFAVNAFVRECIVNFDDNTQRPRTERERAILSLAKLDRS